jgi:NAD(P)-dependent dehydrogenase (short-subunit alcohol dehydrogenase family)
VRFSGKTAIVSGGNGSIGGSIARALAAEGCAVGLIDVQPSSDVAADIQRLGARAVDYPANIADAKELSAAVKGVTDALGGLDIVVNAAGVTSFGSAASLDEAEWDRVLAINLKGVFLACQAAIEPLRARGGGRIVNIGSVLAKNGGNARPWIDPAEQKASGNVAYGVSKAGVHALTFYLARELAPFGITVNCVSPGPIASPMTKTFPQSLASLIPLRRLGQPAEVAAAVMFLASDDATFITGEVLDVNGGSWSD